MNARDHNNQRWPSARYAELKHILEERRREILERSAGKDARRAGRGCLGEAQGVLDAAEASEADIQDDIEFALIQMKSETLHKIEEALGRLDEGDLRRIVSNAATRFRSGACGRCPLRSAARIARKPVNWPSSASVRRSAAPVGLLLHLN